MRIKLWALIGLLVSATSYASWFSKEEKDDNPFKDVPEKQLYQDAKAAVKKGQYTSAIKRLEAMESLYPFSDYAEKAEMDLIFSYYKNEEYTAASATAERFIHLYPRAKHVDYAYYMKGLANFQQNRGMFAKVLPLDESWRDTGTQSQAYTDFAVLVERFPNSRYKPDALQRMVYLRNMFAKRELHTAEYYLDRKMYVAAASRASYLIKNYPQAPSTQQALKILAQANRALGLKQASKEAILVKKATYGRTQHT